MAKKKKAAKDNSSNTSNEKLSLAERLKNLDKISAEISEKNPSILMGRVNTTLIQNKLKGKFIPTASLELNQMIGGGFPKGKLTILALHANILSNAVKLASAPPFLLISIK